jgi:hypothetical protein
MPRGASPKREREYKKIENKFEKSGRYRGREKEVAARIVNKQRARAGEIKGSKQKTARKQPAASRSRSRTATVRMRRPAARSRSRSSSSRTRR